MDSKVCKKCNTNKTLLEFSRNKSMSDGRLNKCKACISNETRRPAKIKPTHTHKICKGCKEDKSLDCFSKSKGSRDGHEGKCKPCRNKLTYVARDNRKTDPEYIEKTNTTRRSAWHRLGYNDFHKKSPEYMINAVNKYRKLYPEKAKATATANYRVTVEKGFVRHHWSYNEIHRVDIIPLSRKDHSKAHRFIVYDQERFIYRRYDTNELLDTKEKHLEFITWCIENKED